MKFIKKITAVLLAMLFVLGSVAVTAGAVGEKATFEMNVVSENSSQVVVEFNLTDGSFSSLDMQFKIGGNVTACESITATTELNNLGVMFISREATRKASMITVSEIKAPLTVLKAVFTKKTSATVTANDLKAVVSACSVSSDDGTITPITDKVTVKNSYSQITLSSAKKEVNYKDTFTLTNTGAYSGSIVWSSSNESVAKVDADGKVTATGSGTAVITAASPDGTVTATCEVKVTYAWWQVLIRIVLLGFLWY